MLRAVGLIVLLGALGCTGCDKDFDDAVAQVRVNAQPIKLEGEQVVLRDDQVDCGVQKELWEAPVPVGDRRVARLLQAGRDLKFFDDVMIEKSGNAFAQVRGDITVELIPPFDTAETSPGVKIVTGKVAAFIKHACFASSLPIMGVRKGEFAADAPLKLRYVQDGKDWQFDRLEH